MKLRIDAYIDRETLVWATWYCVNHGMPTTKKRVLSFLREQVSQFGTCSDTLVGASAQDDMDASPQDLERAEGFVSKWFPNE